MLILFFSDIIYVHVYLFKIADKSQITYVNVEAGLLHPESCRIRECTTFSSADPDNIRGHYSWTKFAEKIRGQFSWIKFVDPIGRK